MAIRPSNPKSLEEALKTIDYPSSDPVTIDEVTRWKRGEDCRDEVRMALAMAFDKDLADVPE